MFVSAVFDDAVKFMTKIYSQYQNQCVLQQNTHYLNKKKMYERTIQCGRQLCQRCVSAAFRRSYIRLSSRFQATNLQWFSANLRKKTRAKTLLQPHGFAVKLSRAASCFFPFPDREVRRVKSEMLTGQACVFRRLQSGHRGN